MLEAAPRGAHGGGTAQEEGGRALQTFTRAVSQLNGAPALQLRKTSNAPEVLTSPSRTESRSPAAQGGDAARGGGGIFSGLGRQQQEEQQQQQQQQCGAVRVKPTTPGCDARGEERMERERWHRTVEENGLPWRLTPICHSSSITEHPAAPRSRLRLQPPQRQTHRSHARRDRGGGGEVCDPDVEEGGGLGKLTTPASDHAHCRLCISTRLM
ncbi:unnamed protein product [Pleuronectes platessa]|uniref:Uncharacterized protein n=1 Tax=Pleuronectes platessa TaxID=8262 RepID=A0A9N7YAT9_PLEPL|nr:unnamed protein product [Pleuronectes platessa]